jgi:hypothetical protein
LEIAFKYLKYLSNNSWVISIQRSDARMSEEIGIGSRLDRIVLDIPLSCGEIT